MSKFMNKIHFGLAKIPGSRGHAVMAKVHMVAPKAFEKGILRPTVIGLSDALGSPKASGGSQPQP
jgi:hypothetical protein